MNKNFLRIINLIEELGSEKKTPITIQQYQDIINKKLKSLDVQWCG